MENAYAKTSKESKTQKGKFQKKIGAKKSKKTSLMATQLSKNESYLKLMSEKQQLYIRIVALKHYSSNAFSDDVKRYVEISKEIEVLTEELKEQKTVGEYFKMMTKNV